MHKSAAGREHGEDKNVNEISLRKRVENDLYEIILLPGPHAE
jgi:hypothetical protein